jgi:hypothetical protein
MGRSGLAATAISALDAALWDLNAKLLDLPLAALLGRARTDVPIYGSGGFTSYDDRQLMRQLSRWVEQDGCRAMKMEIGSYPDDDLRRVNVAKEAIGEAALFVDANGAYSVKQALHMADAFAAEAGVAWFEEPVSSDDLDGLAQVRASPPACMTSPPANTPTTPMTSGICSFAARWTCSRPMRRDVSASRASCRRQRFATPIISTFRVIARRRFMFTRHARRRVCVISNGFMTTVASNICCSTARPSPRMALSSRI